MINDAIIEALVIIGNAKKVKEICEPNITEPMELKAWMVIRALAAWELFENEWQRLSEDSGRPTQETIVSNKEPVRGNP